MQFFDQEFIEFFKNLKKNNNREWFNENKKLYEKAVKEPFENFIQDLILSIREDDENLMVTTKESIFRIYRDIRFSKDKSPYKTQVSAVVVNGGRKNNTDPGVYIELDDEGIRFYGGIYQMSKEQIQNVREFIASNLEEFKKLQNDRKFKNHFGEIRGEKNVRIPKEFKEAFVIEPLIANKQFYYISSLDSKTVISKSITKQIMTEYFIAKPMNTFFKQALS